MKIITRDWVHSDISFFTQSTRRIDKSELSSLINFWKKILIEHGASPGKKIGIGIFILNDTYLGILFAAFELGLQLVILNKPNNITQTKYPKFNTYFPLDILILNKNEIMEELVFNHLTTNSKAVINCNEYQLVETSDISTNISSNFTCLLCTSSGSTDDPKLINHTHEFFYDLCSINWKSLEFTEEDRVLHLTSFNHGSALGIYFLPSTRVSKYHYLCIENFLIDRTDEENWNTWLSFCQENNITKIQSGYAQQTDYMISAIKRSDKGLPDLTIYVLSFINPEWLEVVKAGKLKKIISIFGCSETSGPLFLPFIDHNTDKNFNPKLLGHPIEGYHKIYLDENSELSVDLPTYQTTIKTQDYLKITDQGYLFISKKKIYRINDIEINIIDLQDIFHQVFKGSAHTEALIIVDEVYNKLYAVSADQELVNHYTHINEEVKKFYNNKVQLDGFYFIEHPENFITGIKPDREKLLDYIRQNH